MRLALLLLSLAVPGHAELPLDTWPGCGTVDRPDLCPSDLNGDWMLIGSVPSAARDSVRSVERQTGSGCHADEAWQYTTGRWEVVLGVLDSGIEWENWDLVHKVFLNVGELPLPQGSDGKVAGTYDLDGNGLVNVDDFASDPRVDWNVGRDPADGMLDPSDLIYTFSDGVDDDADGFVDDIAGWDFFGDDNDPYNEYSINFGTHGSGVMEEMGAEGGDGGDIGVCPNCAILPVRVADTFVADGGRVGQAVAFATDAGARVLNMSIGAITYPEILRRAMAYAHDQGVVISAAAGDENAYHANYPAVADDALFVHSIRADNMDEGGSPYSYMNFFHCNNYGPRLSLVATNNACATGATAITTGVAGLVVSAGLDAGLDLSVDEVIQVILGSVDDVWLNDEEREIAATLPSGEGWDAFYGYGKINAGRAVERVFAGEIPPVARITSPGWYDEFPRAGGAIAVKAVISTDRAASHRWALELGTGFDPRQWTTIADGEGSTAFSGDLASLDLETLPTDVWNPIPGPSDEEGILERVDRVHAPMVTLRLRVWDDQERMGEARKTFSVQDDPDLLPGFPVSLSSSGESPPVLADLDGDGLMEIVVGSSSGQVFAFRGDGSLMDGFPLSTGVIPEVPGHGDAAAYASGSLPLDAGDGVLAGLAVGDLQGDGVPEIVVATTSGFIHAWSGTTGLAGFPYEMVGREPDEYDDNHTYDRGFMSAPTLEDLAGDGHMEIVVSGMDGRLYVVDVNGEDWGPWPVEMCLPDTCGVMGYRSISSPAVGDLDGDGDMDIVCGSNETPTASGAVSFAWDARTALSLPGWPITAAALVPATNLLPVIGEGHPNSLAMADLDGDGDMELANPIMFGQTDILHHDGTVAVELPYGRTDFGSDSNVDEQGMVQMLGQPAFGDLDGDGTPDLLLSGTSTMYLLSLALATWEDFQHLASAWSGVDGAYMPGWPRQVEDIPFLMGQAVADVTGDGRPEAIVPSAGYLVHAWDADGVEAPGWPHSVGEWLMGSPAVGDVDGDGLLDVVAISRGGRLYAWGTAGRADQQVEWASQFHDARNTGNYGTPLPVQAGPPDTADNEDDDEEGCGCRGKDKSRYSLVLLPLGLGWWGSRKRGLVRVGGSRSPRARL